MISRWNSYMIAHSNWSLLIHYNAIAHETRCISPSLHFCGIRTIHQVGFMPRSLSGTGLQEWQITFQVSWGTGWLEENIATFEPSICYISCGILDKQSGLISGPKHLHYGAHLMMALDFQVVWFGYMPARRRMTCFHIHGDLTNLL